MIWALAVALLVAVAVAVFGRIAWETHVCYGPIYYGNARWRREAPQREASRALREAVAALTDQDREWLTAMGWKP